MRLEASDARAFLANLTPDSLDSCVTDPPYDLLAMSRNGSRRVNKNARANPFSRHDRGNEASRGGFMNLAWDATGIAFDPEFWTLVYRALKPGAHLVAFGGTRTFWRMIPALVDAGFAYRDTLCWIYGSGFPKSLQLDGGKGTGLKPAWEPIVLVKKPHRASVAAAVAQYGTGALEIDACRIEGRDRTEYGLATSTRSQGSVYHSPSATADFDSSKGRWPANLLLSCECPGELHLPDCPIVELDLQSGSSQSHPGKPRASQQPGLGWGMTKTGAEYRDRGGASRFFYCAKASRKEREEGLSALESGVFHRVNPGGIEHDPRWAPIKAKNIHPTVKPLKIMRWLCRVVTPPGGTILDPFLGSGTTAVAAVYEDFDLEGCDQNERYVSISRARVAHAQETREAERLALANKPRQLRLENA